MKTFGVLVDGKIEFDNVTIDADGLTRVSPYKAPHDPVKMAAIASFHAVPKIPVLDEIYNNASVCRTVQERPVSRARQFLSHFRI